MTYRRPFPPPPGPPSALRWKQSPTVYAAVFRGGSESYLQVLRLDGWDFGSLSLSREELDDMLGSSTEQHEIYDVDARIASGVSMTEAFRR